VDWYNGGMEHATLHLLYSRFWHKFLYDIGIVPYAEPYAKRTSHGMILGENGEKMSKSRGNVINPDDIIAEFGADTLRLYEMFIGDFEKTAPWSPAAVKGCRRFLERVWALNDNVLPGDTYSPKLERVMNRAIKKVSQDIEEMKFNTAIAELMTLVNSFYDTGCNEAEYKTFIALLSPFAPHICEELWENHGGRKMLAISDWPSWDEAKTVDETVEMPVQINGKLRATVTLPRDCSVEEAEVAALADKRVQSAIEGKALVKKIVIPNKIINLVVK
jgi:leucyl-tRNA synthetase